MSQNNKPHSKEQNDQEIENPYSKPPSHNKERILSKSYMKALSIYKKNILFSTAATVAIALPAIFLLSFVSYEKSITTRRRHVSFLKERALGQCIVEQIRGLKLEKDENNQWSFTSFQGIEPVNIQNSNYIESKDQSLFQNNTLNKNNNSSHTNMKTNNERDVYLEEKISKWVNNNQEMDPKLIQTICSHFRANYQQSCRKHFEVFYPELLEAAFQNRAPETMYMELIVNQSMSRREELLWALKSMFAYFLPGGKNPIYQKFWWGEDEV